MIIATKFGIGAKVKTNFDDIFFGDEEYGIVKEININLSWLGEHVVYTVAHVIDGNIQKTFQIDECDLEDENNLLGGKAYAPRVAES